MTRTPFPDGSTRPARLWSVTERPIENRAGHHSLLRIEFEMFIDDTDLGILRSLGTVACQDLVLCHHEPDLDEGVAGFVFSMRVPDPHDPDSWTQLADADDLSRPWVCITFGEERPVDKRNDFRDIRPYDPGDKTVIECETGVTPEWLTIPRAAQDLDMTEATFRRRLAETLERHPEWEGRLRRRRNNQHGDVGAGQHSEINMVLARHEISRYV